MKPKHSVHSTEIPPLLSGITTADKYLAVLAAHEDWHRCIVDDYTFIDKPNKVLRKTTHGYIQRQLTTDNKAEGEKFLEETEKNFADIVARFPGWQTPDPIIRYKPKQGMYYRQLRFTYDENEKFMQVIPEYLAIINADPSKLDFIFDKYAAAKAKCCKFECTTPSASVIKNKKASIFEYDYDTAISKFIASLASPEAKKTANHILKRHFEQFYKELFPQWITEDITDTIDYYWVEANVSGGRTRETYDYIRDRYGECITNLIELAGIYYQRLCSECGIQPSDTFLRMFYPILYNEIELLKLKFGVLSGTSTESEKIIQNFQEKIWRNGFNDVTLEQLDNIINEIQNGKEHTPTYGQNIGGDKGRIFLAAVVICGAGREANRTIPTSYFQRSKWSDRCGQLLEKWAKGVGCWIENAENYLTSKGYIRIDIETGESIVFRDAEYTTAIKIMGANYYANMIDKSIDRIMLHNYLFPDTALEIIGFTYHHGTTKVIAKQKFIQGIPASEDDVLLYIDEHFKGYDYDHTNGHFVKDGIEVGDIHEGNIVKTKDGELYVIDCYARFQGKYFSGFSGTASANPNAVKTDFDDVYAATRSFYGKGYSGKRVNPRLYYFDIKGEWNKFFKLLTTTPSYYILRPIRRFGGDFFYRKNLDIAVDSATWENCFKHITAYPTPLFDNEILLIKQKYKPTKNR